MPTAAKKPTVKTQPAKAQPAAPAITAPAAGPARPVVHPELTVNGVPIPREKLRLTDAFLRDLLGLETETEYKARCAASDDQEVRAKGILGFGDEFLPGSEAMFGEKVRCWNNLDNRPFDPNTAEKYCQDAGDKNWAGFDTMRDNEDEEMPLAAGGTVRVRRFTVNGETIIVGRTGKVESGQHRAIGGILLVHRWRQDPSRYPLWTEEPFIESLVVFGVSEHPTVVRTLDNVRPRQLSDTVYTSDMFKTNPDGGATTQRQRRDLSRMVDAAVDLLWKRTGAAFAGRFQTHSTSFDFLDRHAKLRDAVRLVFDVEESEKTYRALARLSLSPGQTAAAVYLMAAGRSDAARYAGDRSQAALDMSLWKTAERFVAGLSAPKDKMDRSFRAVKAALGELPSLDDGLGGRAQEKLAVLAAAWHLFREGKPIEESDLALAYGKDGNGNSVLLDPPTFGGIDLGHDPQPPETLTPKQVEAEKARVRAERAKAAVDAVKDGLNPENKDRLAALREEHANSILLFVNRAGDYNVFGEDAQTLGRDADCKVTSSPTGPAVRVARDGFEAVVSALHAKGYNLKVVSDRGGIVEVTEVKRRPARPAGTAAPVQAAKGPAPAKANGTAAGPKAATAPTVNGDGKGKLRKPALKGGIG